MNKIDNEKYTVDISLDKNGDGYFIVYDKINKNIIQKTPYLNNKKNGVSIEYFYGKANGRRETPYIDDKINGMVVQYVNDIIFREESFIDNKREGITRDYKIIEGKPILWFETSYKNHMKNGLSIEYNDDGITIKKKTMWQDEKEV